VGFRPQPRWRSLQRFPDLLARIKGTYFYGKGRGVGSGKEGREGKGVEETPCMSLNFPVLYTTLWEY